MIENDPHNDWLFREKEDQKTFFEDEKEAKSRKPKRRYGSKIKSKVKKIQYKLGRTFRGIGSFARLLLGLIAPVLVGLIVLYLLEPGMSLISQYSELKNTVSFLLVVFLIPAGANSYVPWIAWIASGFTGGIIYGKVLVPFISTYVITWFLLFILEGDAINQSFEYIGGLGLSRILIQRLAINFIFAILAFGFGGWIGASIGGK